MILVIGGYSQGKLEFAVETLHVKNASDGLFVEGADCVYNLHTMVMQENFEEHLNTYLAVHPDAVLICNEVGCGVVPMTKEDREYREKVGRTCCKLAKQAEAVYRVFCGIGTKIK